MTVSMTSIPVLHSAEVAHLYPQVVLPICHRVDQTPYTSTEEARQGNTKRPLQSSTSFRKPATVYGKLQCRNPLQDRHHSKILPRASPGIPCRTAITAKSSRGPSQESLAGPPSQQNPPEGLPTLTTPLLPLPLSGKVVLH